MIETANRSVTLTTTGVMQVSLAGKPLQFSSRKALAILTYLALQSARSESRERIATMLWSDSGPDQARGALRQTLRRLKQDLGPAGELLEAVRSWPWNEWPHVEVRGLMAMATFTDDLVQVRREFDAVARLFGQVKALGVFPADRFTELSLGMTSDLDEAIAAGSTLVRVGTAIFGERPSPAGNP